MPETENTPLELSLLPGAARLRAGEGAVLEIQHEIHAPLRMETVELNRDRTRIRVVALDGPDSREEILTGLDHARLHHKSNFERLGAEFQAPAGASWRSALDLLNFRRPFTAGRYRIELSYRYGERAEETVGTNAVVIEVEPTRTNVWDHRWFGGAHARDRLGSLWSAGEGTSAAWFYRVASRHDPAAATVSTCLGPAPAGALGPPRLAHLNDIADFHFHRYAVWTTAGGLGWWKIGAFGSITPPQETPHGLLSQPAPLLIDPPLQGNDGGLSAVVVGSGESGPCASLIEIGADGTVGRRLVPLPETPRLLGGVLWSSDGNGRLFWAATDDHETRVVWLSLGDGRHGLLDATSDELLALPVEQWLGRGRVLALTRRASSLLVRAWEGPDPGPGPVLAQEYGLPAGEDSPGGPFDVTTLDDGAGLAVLLRRRDGWVTVEPAGWGRVGFEDLPAGSDVRLVATPRSGLFLLMHHERQGFVAIPPQPWKGPADA